MREVLNIRKDARRQVFYYSRLVLSLDRRELAKKASIFGSYHCAF